MSYDCPSCDRSFETQQGVKIHHKRTHGISLKPQVSCDNCGKALYRKPSRLKKSERHFCGTRCMYEWQSEHWQGQNNHAWSRIKVTCDHCGESFYKTKHRVERSKRHFCCIECRREWDRRQTGGKLVTLFCDHCGASFERPDYEIQRSESHFCSYRCSREFLKRRVIITCSYCGKQLERQAWCVEHADISFCGHHCRAAWQSQNGRVAVTCDACGAEFDKKLSQFNSTNHHFCSRDCFHAWLRGANSPLYRDGATYNPYPAEFSPALKQYIRERDNHTCQLCSKTRDEEGRNLSVHHINYDKTDNSPSNLIALCNACNVRCNHNHLQWQLWFQDYQRHRGYATQFPMPGQ